MSLLLGLTAFFAWAPWATSIFTVGFLAVCMLMVLTVLIQKPQGGGLASAFGGGGSGSGQTAFGTKTGDALTIFTIIIFVVYLGFAIMLNYASKPQANAAPQTQSETDESAAPAEPAANPAATPPVTPPTNQVTPSAPVPAQPAPAQPATGEPAPSQPTPAPQPAPETAPR